MLYAKQPRGASPGTQLTNRESKPTAQAETKAKSQARVVLDVLLLCDARHVATHRVLRPLRPRPLQQLPGREEGCQIARCLRDAVVLAREDMKRRHDRQGCARRSLLTKASRTACAAVPSTAYDQSWRGVFRALATSTEYWARLGVGVEGFRHLSFGGFGRYGKQNKKAARGKRHSAEEAAFEKKNPIKEMTSLTQKDPVHWQDALLAKGPQVLAAGGKAALCRLINRLGRGAGPVWPGYSGCQAVIHKPLINAWFLWPGRVRRSCCATSLWQCRRIAKRARSQSRPRTQPQQECWGLDRWECTLLGCSEGWI
ncbi:uncharacterized protein B0I36DRAFT_324883 [Microdochium trichocladiopsis]|uniref:Uncharacterized protein n=1 Tax=Microdochium trichocladiopsis TaxID=1682393 RepID=A0A9P8Y463_9PEZI|nr:uncharacterized protein B0I36DRAFT_324883 [Microdochium trichocladiopsis]KAH7029030.1 hypothetical protein B0I36DRAFT_324883 [Microdochium trichocladiopsis]